MEVVIHGDKEKMLEYLVELINTAKKIHPDIWDWLKTKIDGVNLTQGSGSGTFPYNPNISNWQDYSWHNNTVPCTTTETGPTKETDIDIITRNKRRMDKYVGPTRDKTRAGKSIDNIPVLDKQYKLCGSNYSSNIKWLCEKCFKDDLDGCGEQNCKYLVPVRIEKAVDEYIPIHPVLDCRDKPGDSLCGDLYGKIDDTVRLCDKCLKDWNIYGCGGKSKGALHLYHI